MKDLCALVLGLKPPGCASPASVAVLDTATHTEKQHTGTLANVCAHTCIQNTCSVLCVLYTPVFAMCLFISLILAFPADVQAYWIRLIQADIKINTKPCDVCLCFLC